MCCRIVDLRDKQVISIKDGCVIGFVCDVEVDTCNGCIVSIIVLGRNRFFGLFGRETDIVIPWKAIEVIGCDSILVGCDIPKPPKRNRKGFLGSGFYGD